MRQIAVIAGVSKSTVSNVLTNPQVVAEATRLRVERAMEQLGYVPNGAARQLRGGPRQIAGCMLIDVSNPYFAEVARGAEDRLAEAGMMMFLCSTDVELSRQEHYLRMLEEQGVRGVLVWPLDLDLTPLVQVQRRGTPLILMGRSGEGLDMCTVDVDDGEGGRLAAEHVIALGHRRLVYVCGAGLTLDRRRQELRRTAETAVPSVHLTEIEIPPRADVTQIDDAVETLVSLEPRPTAVLCFNDQTAVSVLHALRRRGIRVPDDISLVGYDDLPFAAVLSPPLTTIRQPGYELGRVAAEQLLAEGSPDHRHQGTRFPVELVVRASTSPVR